MIYLCHGLVQICSWVYFPEKQRKRPAENENNHRPHETLLRPAIFVSSGGDNIKLSSEASC